MNTVISSREAYPVRIGALLLYCDNFKASCSRNYAEQATTDGSTVFSNTNKRALKVTFEGRIYEPNNPLYFLRYADGFMTSGTAFQVEYRGTLFSDCYVQSFIAEDKGDDYIYASITLITSKQTMED